MRQKHSLSRETIFRISFELRKQGKVVGLTHGAFDLFHSSHLDLLRKASRICDFLIVGIDSDESVRAYKPYGRPFINQISRADIINELTCVDAVFIKDLMFMPSEYTQMLYKEIKPNFVAIGQNYAVEDKVLFDTSRSGVNLLKIDTEQDYTTTKIMEKIIKTQEKLLKKQNKLLKSSAESLNKKKIKN